MKETPTGTPVGVDDPYDHAGVCDHLTDEGKCRFAFENPEQDPEFARERRRDDLRCPAVDPDSEALCASKRSSGERSDPRDGDWNWEDCPHYRCRNRNRECVRCGLGERRMAHSDERPLLEEHHLSYAGEGETLSHEITVFLCRWCHAKVHKSWARIDDDVNPDPEAIAEKEGRRSREQSEAGFESAAERFDLDDET
ncbi:hypothetical protein M0R89_10245 [Halorussus limi]|uniref:Uncharacterized protein n=1 Tax=Halorussus limi TaxID=2938695 RepID=A0A8U0HPX6_9EURY|nr:hypothetical protein [Halorussus limi]UPV72927.1 hypothetical protein M0R89_10245 [Halorussus limi]